MLCVPFFAHLCIPALCGQGDTDFPLLKGWLPHLDTAFNIRCPALKLISKKGQTLLAWQTFSPVK